MDLPLSSPLSTLIGQVQTSKVALNGAAILLVAFLFFKLLQVGRRDPRLPPGPPTLPIIGNLHQVPVTGLHKKFKEWGEQYGGVFSLKFGPGTMIVLFDRQAVHDLVDKKGNIYSERPLNHIASLVTHGDSFAFMDSTPLWRSQRKVASHNLSPRSLDEKVAPVQDAESAVLLYDILTSPENFFRHVQRTTASVANSIVWGHRGQSFEDFWGHNVYDALDQYSDALEPGANPPVDEFPFLKYIPDRFAPWARRAKQSYSKMDAVWLEARRRVEARRQRGEIRNSIYDRLMDDQKGSEVKLTDSQINHFLGVIVEGGADTTASSVLTSLLYMARYPEFQDKARKEIDRACGPDRIPQWSDFNSIPYINCLVKEAMRIRPVLPLGVPHRVNKDDWYKGMLIPKDSSVVVPAWALHFSDKTGYEDPKTYKPDRWSSHPKLANDYAGSGDFDARGEEADFSAHHYGYGAGRRICPGIHLAERTQWRLTARILWAFEIVRPIDPKTGEPVELDMENYREGLNHCPHPFHVIFKPRSEAHMETIRAEFEKARSVLKIYD